jgi:hypothetical protein
MIRSHTFVDNLELFSSVADDPRLRSKCVVGFGTSLGGMAAALMEILDWHRGRTAFSTASRSA